MISSLPVAVTGTWGSVLNNVIEGINTSYLSVIDNITSTSNIPGTVSSSSLATMFTAIGVDIGNINPAINNIVSGTGFVIQNSVVITGTYTTTIANSNFNLSASGPQVYINGELLTVTGTASIPTSTTLPVTIYASSTASLALTTANGVSYSAVLTSSNPGSTLSGPQIVELGLFVVNSSVSSTFTPASPLRTYFWSTTLPALSTSTYTYPVTSSTLFYIPLLATSTISITSYVSTASGTFVNPDFLVTSLVTSSVAYSQLMVGVRPILFPTGTVTSTFLITTSTSGTVTSTVGLTGFLATGTGANLALLTPIASTFVIRW
jgi:hypothetical protein